MTIGVILTIIGFILHIWLVSEAYMYLRTNYGPSVRFQEIRYQMRKYMAFKRLSPSIQKRIMSFYDFSFNGNFFRKREINEMLGHGLRNSVTMETCKQLLVENYFFKQLPEELLNSMANCMTEMVFLCNDVICKADSTRAQVDSIDKCLAFFCWNFLLSLIYRSSIWLWMEQLLFIHRMETRLHICMMATCLERLRSFLLMKTMWEYFFAAEYF